MKSINSEEFFKQVAVNSGIADLPTVKNVYYGMVRTLSRELRAKRVVDAPDWGEFSLGLHKARRALNVNTGNLELLPARPTLKFRPDYKVKKYFQAWAEANN